MTQKNIRLASLVPAPAAELAPALAPAADLAPAPAPAADDAPLPAAGAFLAPPPPARRRSARLAAAEEPCFLSMLDKAALLRKRKTEGGARTRDAHPDALALELLEVAVALSFFCSNI